MVGNVVEHWQRCVERQRTVAFAVSIEHSRHLVERFQAVKVPAEHLDGSTPTMERDAILGRLERGETRVVVNVGVLCEGWDQPCVKCCILARPTKSTGLYLQQAGRILRPWTDPTTGQTPRAILLDHAGCVVEHGLPQDDREFSLEGTPKKGRRLSANTDSTEKAEEAIVAEKSVPSEAERELIEFTKAFAEERRSEWDRLCAEEIDKDEKTGWAERQYKERFGAAPPRSFPRSQGFYSEEEKRAHFRELEAIARVRGYRRGYVFVRYRDRFGEAPPEHFEANKDDADQSSAAFEQLPLPTAFQQPTSD